MRKIPFAGIELTSQRVRGYMVPLSIIHGFYRGKSKHKRKDFVLSGCGTYFILVEDNTIQQYSTVQYSTV